MRLKENRKGAVHVIEAFFAAVLLMSCLAIIPSPDAAPASTDNHLASTAQNLLVSLDNNGRLGCLIENNDWAGLKSSLASALPLTYWFYLTVYDQNMTCLNPYPISNTGAINNKIASINYVCVSQSSNYAIYVLQLQLSTVD
jgi:hypothetical protein